MEIPAARLSGIACQQMAHARTCFRHVMQFHRGQASESTEIPPSLMELQPGWMSLLVRNNQKIKLRRTRLLTHTLPSGLNARPRQLCMQTPACPALSPPALASATYWRATILGAARRTVRGTPDSRITMLPRRVLPNPRPSRGGLPPAAASLELHLPSPLSQRAARSV